MSSDEAKRILAEADKAKEERIEREDKEALEAKLKEEEEKAKQHLDAQVLQDQADEAAYDAFVKAQQQGGPERPPPVLRVGGTSFTWSGHPDANVRAPPEPTEFQDRTNQILEESEKDVQTAIDQRKVAIAVQTVIAQQLSLIHI